MKEKLLKILKEYDSKNKIPDIEKYFEAVEEKAYEEAHTQAIKEVLEVIGKFEKEWCCCDNEIIELDKIKELKAQIGDAK